MARLKIDYIEFNSSDLPKSKDFLAKAFEWVFQDYGPTYSAALNAGVDAGVQGDPSEAGRAPLIVLKADDLEAVERDVKAAGGVITTPLFSFPGGRRFHFREPGGVEMAVWGV